MKLTTSLSIPKATHPIDYKSEVVSIGSCFAENMAGKLRYFGFNSTANPFGILFSPAAIEKAIGFGVNRKAFTEDDVFQHNDIWSCFDAHSDLSHPNQDTHLQSLNKAAALLNEKLLTASHLVITLGTAWVYRNTAGALVANCHKVPQKGFSKELLSIDAIAASLQNIAEMLNGFNPNIHLIFTVSPVRHLKDGFAENQRSKAHLIAALHTFLSKNTSFSHYFPAYEIMMDELRDYRFYATDMLHPNTTAIDYIWEKFTEAWLSESTFPIMKEVGSIRQATAHRPFNPSSDAHRHFLAKLDQQKATLLLTHPSLKL